MNIVRYLLVTLFWGGSYLGIHYVVEIFSPVVGSLLRVALALGLMLVYARLGGYSLRLPRPVRRMSIAFGILSMGIAWPLLFWGELHVAPAVAAILIGATPLFVKISLCVVQPRAHWHARQAAGLLIGFLGIVCVFSPQLLHGETHAELLGLLAILLAALLYGISIALIELVPTSASATILFIWQALGALAVLVPLACITGGWPSLDVWRSAQAATVSLIYLSVCSTALAFVFWNQLIRNWGGVVASTATFVVPVVSLLLDAFVLRQIPDWPVLTGAAIISTGIALVRRKPVANRESRVARAT